MIKNIREIIKNQFKRGLNTNKNFFSLEEGQSPSCINVVFNNDASISKKLGTSTMNTIALENTGGYGMYDFGVLGVGGNDDNVKLLLHCEGANNSATFIDSSRRNYSITTKASAFITTAQSKFGDASGFFNSPEDSNTVLLLHCDGANDSTTFIDETGKSITANGGVKITTSTYKFSGASALFDGNGDYLSIGDSADFNLGQGNFTIDFWFRTSDKTKEQILFDQADATPHRFLIELNGGNLSFYAQVSGATGIIFNTSALSLSNDTWYHVALVRNGTTANDWFWFLNGVSQTASIIAGAADVTLPNVAGTMYIGTYNAAAGSGTYDFYGNFDEIRWSKGSARWTSNFSVPTTPYGLGYLTVPDNDDWNFGLKNFTIDTQVRFNSVLTSQMIVGQGIDTNNQWYFQYGSSPNSLIFRSYTGGTLVTNLSGVWAPNTATWYHLAVVRQTTNNWYIFVDGSSLAATGTTAGIIPDLASLLKIGINVVTTNNTSFNGWLDEFRISNNARWTAAFTSPTVAYSSDLIQERRLLCASGTGIYYSTDIGRTWSIIQTSRTAAINYFGFIKDYVINTNNNYEPPQYWAGIANQYFANISTAAPAAKHSLSHQGFAILLNESANKTTFYYVDQNSMFNSAWSSFKLPTDRNDELTCGFSLGRSLYVSSKYKIFRLNYIGGNPDWEYVEVRGWGFVPKTVKKVNLPGMGEAVIGLDWTKKVRLFFGADDEIISDAIARDNGITQFYLDNISSLYLDRCWAEDDKKEQIYRLYLVYGGSSTVSYCLNFNYRTGAWYPENGVNFQSGILAADTADNLFMLACDYNGKIHQLNSGNTISGTTIDDQYTSSFFYSQSPSRVHKAQQIDLLFATSSSGTIYLEDRMNYSSVWNLRKEMTLASAISSIQIRHTIDVPETTNVYQFKLSSSANTAEPWRLNYIDYSHNDIGVGK